MRLLIIIGCLYLIHRTFIKPWIARLKASRGLSVRSTAVVDDMVKDPYCETYFPKHSGVSAIVDGKEVCFCSVQCKERFLASRQS
jgi:YHS domain-containing protein